MIDESFWTPNKFWLHRKIVMLNVLPKTMYLGFMIISTGTKDTLKTGDMPINLCPILCGTYDTKSK